jgi:stage II sporulation protein AA (anti-sigma F factor antagonist)
MSGHGRVRFEMVGSTRVAHLEGEVDLSNAWSLTQAIVEAMSNQEFGLVIDLTDTRYLDSVGIRFLFDLARRLGERDQQLVVVVPPEALIRRSLEVSGLPREVVLVETVRAATRST